MLLALAQTTRKSKAWNDKQVQAHHAIIPTTKQSDLDKLGSNERKLYEMIARQYLMQFYPEYEYLAARIDLDIAQRSGVLSSCKDALFHFADGCRTVFLSL